MKNIIYLTLIALVLMGALIGLLWVFDVIEQADAVDYGIRVGGAILILAVAGVVIIVISHRGNNPPAQSP